MELVADSINDEGWLLNIGELVHLGLRAEAPEQVWSLLGLPPGEERASLGEIGDGLYRARLESLESESVPALAAFGDHARAVLGDAARCYRVNILGSKDPLRLLLVRAADGRTLAVTVASFGWTVATVGDDALLDAVRSRMAQSERGFVLEEYGAKGVIDGFAWDGHETLAAWEQGSWASRPGTAAHAIDDAARMLGDDRA